MSDFSVFMAGNALKDEVVKYVTAYVKISQNSMLLNEIKEEKL
mgnify:CR=1 FL=1